MAAAASPGVALPGCVIGRGLGGPDVIAASPDDRASTSASFSGDAIAVFTAAPAPAPDPAAGAARLSSPRRPAAAQLRPRPGRAARAWRMSPDGRSVYVGGGLGCGWRSLEPRRLDRRPDPGDERRRLHRHHAAGRLHRGCVELDGADAGAVSADGKRRPRELAVQRSVASFTDRPSGLLARSPARPAAWSSCAPACFFGRAIDSPEGIAGPPDGASVYVASSRAGTIAVASTAIGAPARSPEPLAPAARRPPRSARAPRLSGPARRCSTPTALLLRGRGKSDAITIFRRVARQPRRPTRAD